MPENDHALTVGPCDICGDSGYAELIVRCSKCNVNREHRYCMRVVLTEVPGAWLCESCQSKSGTTSPCKVNQNCNLQASKRQKFVRTGKVKFLNEDEVIKLASGNFPGKPIPTSSTLQMTKKAYVGSKNVSQKIPSLQKPNPCISSPTVHGKLPRNEVQKNQMTDHTSHSLPKGQPTENRLVAEQLICEQILNKKVQTLDLHVEKLAKGAPHKVVPARKSVPISGLGAVAECNKSDIKKSNIQGNFHHHKKYLPSSICAWRGQFQILQAAASGEFYDGFEARPPCVVNRKAYECSIKMPSVLRLESLPALNVLTDIFGDDSPSLQDIALYFFPSDHNEGSKNDLNSIFKFMNAKISMLRSFIDGVELLVFTSRDLNTDSRDTIAGLDEGNFMWGVFRKNKADGDIGRLPDLENIDMDIDMIGGKDMMGRIDHVLKGKPRSLTQEKNVDDDIERLPDLENVDMDIDMIGGKDMMGRIDHVLKDKARSLTPENKVDDDIERLPELELENADMDIDMIGGKDLMGRIDHVLNYKPRSPTQSSEETPVLLTTSKKVEENTLATSSLNLCDQDKSVLSEGLKKKIKSEETPVLLTTSKKVEGNTLATSSLNLCDQDKSVLSEGLKTKIKSEPSFVPFSLKSRASNLLMSTCGQVDVPPGFEAHSKSFS